MKVGTGQVESGFIKIVAFGWPILFWRKHLEWALIDPHTRSLVSRMLLSWISFADA